MKNYTRIDGETAEVLPIETAAEVVEGAANTDESRDAEAQQS